MKKEGNIAVLTVGLLGAAKLILEAFGIPIITDDQINVIANGVSAVATVIATYMNNHKHNVE